MSIDVVIRNTDYSFATGVWIIDRDELSKTSKVLRTVSLEWQAIAPGETYPKPTFELDSAQSEAIFTKLILKAKEAGYDPQFSKSESGELSATKLHLKDMQRLVFKDDRINPQVYMLDTTIERTKDRIRDAAKRCSQAAATLKILFPEIFNVND